MAFARSNRLLPILGTLVLLMAILVGFKSCTGDSPGLRGLLDRVPRAPAPDADTPAETIRTLTARVAEMTAQMEALREENAVLIRRDPELRQSIKQDILDDIEARQSRQPPSETPGILENLKGRLETLSGRVSELSREVKTGAPKDPLPIGRGLTPKVPDAGGFVWTEPLDRDRTENNPQAGLLASPASQAPASPPAKTGPIPYYTVPANATLIGSTGLTALIGRIPVNGQVQDPMPFKVIVGKDNLAANGITIPHVDGMIWSGTAVGDWNLSCVTGRLESVTFVFQDGTIRTLESEGDERLGWISDDQGIPCVSGERITNAAAFLTNRIGIGAIEAAAEAAAAAQTTTRLSEIGRGASSVTGDVGRYVAGKTLAGGAAEIRQWLDERLGQSFDAVFVKPGVRLAIHVTRALPIDYDPSGRKVHHAPTDSDASRPILLD